MSESLSYNAMLLALHSLSLLFREQKNKNLWLQTEKNYRCSTGSFHAGGHITALKTRLTTVCVFSIKQGYAKGEIINRIGFCPYKWLIIQY